MTTKSKRRREQTRTKIAAPKPRRPEQHLCRVCGAEGRYEVYKGPDYIRYYCERHIRDEL